MQCAVDFADCRCAWSRAGLTLHLASLRERKPEELASGECFQGNVIVEDDAVIGKDCKIGPNVSIGKGCKIGDGVRLVNCVLLHRVEVRAAAACLSWPAAGNAAW